MLIWLSEIVQRTSFKRSTVNFARVQPSLFSSSLLFVLETNVAPRLCNCIHYNVKTVRSLPHRTASTNLASQFILLLVKTITRPLYHFWNFLKQHVQTFHVSISEIRHKDERNQEKNWNERIFYKSLIIHHCCAVTSEEKKFPRQNCIFILNFGRESRNPVTRDWKQYESIVLFYVSYFLFEFLWTKP